MKDNLILHIKDLEKKNKLSLKLAKGREQQRSEQKQKKQRPEKINNIKSQPFEKVSKVEKLLAQLIKKKRQGKIRNEREDITTYKTNIKDQRYYEQLYIFMSKISQ